MRRESSENVGLQAVSAPKSMKARLERNPMR